MAVAADAQRTAKMDEQEDREPVDALLQLLSEEVVQRLALAHWDPAASATAAETDAAAASSTAMDESAVAASVFEVAKGWPRTHRHFHRLDALLVDEHEPHDVRALESALRRLKRVQQPPSPTAHAAAAAAAVPSSAAPRAAVAAPSSPSSSSFLSSFFSAATPARPLDVLPELCTALNSHTNSSASASSPEEALRALAGLEDIGAAELVHATTDQWQLLLAALQRCGHYRCDLGPSKGRTTAQATAVAPSKPAARSTTVAPSASSKQKAGTIKKKDGKSTAAAARPAPSSSAAAASVPAVGSRKEPAAASADDDDDAILSSFLLSSRATMLLQELHDASDGSVQSVDIFIALLRAMKDTVAAASAALPDGNTGDSSSNNNNKNSDAHSVRWFALLPTDLASLQQHALDSGLTATITAATSTDSRPSPMLLHQFLLRTLLFHQGRLLGQLSHALVPELWLYANEEVQHAVADAAADFWITTIALAHGDVGSSGSSNDGSSSDTSRGDSIHSTLWTMVCMPDVRFQWFRRWMAQHPVRALFHASVARHPLWPRAHATLQRFAREQALELVDHDPPIRAATSSSSSFAAASPSASPVAASSFSTSDDTAAGVLSISAREAASLGRSAGLAFLLEFAISWLPTLVPSPPSITTAAAAAPVAPSSKGARAKKTETKPPQATSAVAAAAVTPAAMRVDLVPLVELCVTMLAGSVLFAASASTDACNACAASPSLLPAPSPSLQTRARLTALSSAAHFLTHALQRTDLFADEGNKEVRTQKMTSLWRTLLSAVDAFLRPPHSFAAQHLRTMVDDQVARWRADHSAKKCSSVNGAGREATQQQPSEEQQPSLQLDLEQQAALTAIIGLAISFVQQGSASAPLLLAVRLDDMKADEQKQQGKGLLELLCRALSIDGEDAGNNGDVAARRFFQFGNSDSGLTPTAAAGSVRAPQVLESMLLELLELCLPPLPLLLPQPDDDADDAAPTINAGAPRTNSASADRAFSARPRSDLRFLRHIATQLSHIVPSLTPSQLSPQHAPVVAAGALRTDVSDNEDEDDDDEALVAQRSAHQQSARVAAWMDVLLHWASLVDGAWAALQASHPAVVLLCCQRVVLLLRSGVARSPCLPWCTGCRNQMKSAPSSSQHDSTSNNDDDDDDPAPWTPSIGVLRFVVPVSSSLVNNSNNSDRDSDDGGGVGGGGVSAVFRDSVVRAGLVHGVLAQLGRLVAQSDDSAPHHWQLAFDLAASPSSASPPGGAEAQHLQPHSLWPLQLSTIVLGNEAALQLLEQEAVLLSDGSSPSNVVSSSSSSFPSAPRPPLFLRLSQLVHAWVLQEEFIEDEDDSERGGALSDAEPTQTSARRSFTPLSALPLQLPLSFPLLFASVSPPSSQQDLLPPSWFGPLPVWLRAVASSCDAHEVGLRLLVGVLSCSRSGSSSGFDFGTGSGSGFAEAMHRWWNLHALLQQQQFAHFDGIEDAATPWRKRLLQLLLLPARQQA